MGRGQKAATFQYDSGFLESGIELSPLVMPLREQSYQFPNLSPTTFRGLPGLLADALPDKFGNALINAWLATGGRNPESFSAVDRLCYVGRRGMGALEFAPAVREGLSRSSKVEVAQLVEIASDILSSRNEFQADDRSEDFADMLRVGTSAGGARAKAVIAWNRETHEVRSGQVDAGEGFSHWLIKFDGVDGNRDKEAFDALGFGAIEYAYSLMAKASGVEMTECRLLEEGERRHFMTRRFDRLVGGGKLHMQTLGAIAHFDFNLAGAYSYEQAFQVMKRLNTPFEQLEQQFRRTVFNIVARNQDDHVKNIAFLMDRQGDWSLSPAYDVTFSFNPTGNWTSTHQMTVNGKRDWFKIADLVLCAKSAGVTSHRAKQIVSEICDVVSRWPEFADEAGVEGSQVKWIGDKHRISMHTD